MKWYYDLKIGTKLISAFVLVSLITGLVGYQGIAKMAVINAEADKMYDLELLGLSHAKEANIALYAMMRAERGVLLASSQKDRTEFASHVERSRKTMLDELELARPLFYSDAGRAVLKQVDEAWAAYYQVHREVLAAAEQDALQTERQSVALALGSGLQLGEAVSTALSSLVELKEQNAADASALTTVIYGKARNLMLALAVGGVLAGLILGYTISRMIATPLGRMAGVAEALARGDIEQQVTVDSADEIGTLAAAFGAMIAAQQDLARSAAAIARGDMAAEVQVRSDKDVVGKAFVEMREAISRLATETGTLVTAARAGDLSQRGDAAAQQGAFRDLVQGINDTIDGMVEPISEASAVLQRLQQKDLTSRMVGQYRGDHEKIKVALNSALDDLEEALGQVGASAEQVASASGEVSSGSQTLAQGASEQASALEEISSSLQEMTSMTQQNALNTQEANSLSDTARERTSGGVESMRRLAQAIEKIKGSSDQTAKIVKTIDEIAFQTNLLALNAAVEAARAGEAGKGFAVVAEEVRSLAMRSAEAAKNTSELIEGAVRDAQNGVTLSEEVVVALSQIEVGIGKVKDVVGEISASSEQQSQGIHQINVAVEQMNSVTQAVAANSEEAASASEELSSQAEVMQGLVGQFTLGTDHRTARRGTQRPRPVAAPAAPVARSAAAATRPAPVRRPVRKPAAPLAAASSRGGNGHGPKARFDAEALIPFSDDADMDTLQEF
jgi:methyl-accepting chemotaxis protein